MVRFFEKLFKKRTEPKSKSKIVWTNAASLSLLSKLNERTNRETKTSEDIKIRRVPLDKLEILAAADASVKAGINLIANHAIPDHSIVGDYAPLVIDTLSTFDRDFDFYMKAAVKHAAIYGNGFQEIGIGSTNQKVTNLFIVDPKTMDFERGIGSTILVDESQKPIGFRQEGRISSDPIPYDKICHFKLDQISDSEMGIGLVEPLATIIITKANIELGLGQAIYRKGFPFLIGTVGNKEVVPTEDMIDDLSDDLALMNMRDELVVPWYYDVKFLESKNSEKMATHLDYFLNMICAGLGIPKPMLFGTGEDTNKATLTGQIIGFDRTLRSYQKLISREYEKKLFGRILASNGIKTSKVPEIIFAEINPEDLNDRATRLLKYARAKAITMTPDIENVIRRSEGFQKINSSMANTKYESKIIQSKGYNGIVKDAWSIKNA